MRRWGLGSIAVVLLVGVFWVARDQRIERDLALEPTTSGNEVVDVAKAPVLIPAPVHVGRRDPMVSGDVLRRPVVPADTPLHIDVRTPDGDQPPHAEIRFADSLNALPFAEPVDWSPTSGTFPLDGARRFVVAEYDGLVSMALETEPGGEFRLTLRPPHFGSLVGRISRPEGLVLKHLWIRAKRFEGVPPPRPTSVFNGSEIETATYRPRAGGYEFQRLAPGSYWVFLTQGISGRVFDASIVTIADRQVRQDLRIERDQLEPLMPLRVLGPDGRLLEAGAFSVFVRRPRARGHGLSRAQTLDATGNLMIRTAVDPQASDHTLGITVRAPRFGTMEHEIEAGRTQSLEVRFATLARSVLRLSGMPETLRSSCQLMLRAPGDRVVGFGGLQNSAFDNQGVARVQVQPGAFEACLVLRVSTDKVRGVLVVVERYLVAVPEGGMEFSRRFPELHEVQVRAMHSGSVWLFRLAPDGEWLSQTLSEWPLSTSSEPRDLLFRAVPAGRYEIEYRVDGKKRRVPLAVPRQLVVTLE